MHSITLNNDNIKLLNIIKINGKPYRIVSTIHKGGVVYSFKAANIFDKNDCIKMVKATS